MNDAADIILYFYFRKTVSLCAYPQEAEVILEDSMDPVFRQTIGCGNGADIGEFWRKNVFEPGSLYHWNEMIERATGEGLTPKYFVADFVN